MANFSQFAALVEKQFSNLVENNNLLFTINDPNFEVGDILWDTYLDAFPEGTDPLYKERTTHDCTACKNYIRNNAGVFAINKRFGIHTIWDFDLDPVDFYADVAIAMAEKLWELIGQRGITFFIVDQSKRGFASNTILSEEGNVITYNHFHSTVPKNHTCFNALPDKVRGELESDHAVIERSLRELTLESVEIVLDLIEDDNLHRGDQYKGALSAFLDIKKKYDSLHPAHQKLYPYFICKEHTTRSAARIRNTAIGTLLTDLSAGEELEVAVAKYENKVSGTNYQRPKALVTKGMLKKAQNRVNELGFSNSLARRPATIQDISVNDILWVNSREGRKLKDAGDVFDQLLDQMPDTVSEKSLSRAKEITIKDFIDTILPKSVEVEVLFENHHQSNLVTLIAPENKDAKPITKWDNGFTWSYKGEVADHFIAERVRAAGGIVDAPFRTSLAWDYSDDLDLHLQGPKNLHVYFGNRKHPNVELDIDRNAHSIDPKPVENIYAPDLSKLNDGTYMIRVHNFNIRDRAARGFNLEFKYGDTILLMEYNRPVRGYVEAVTFKVKNGKLLEYTNHIPATNVSVDLWGMTTKTFQPVSTVMYSPNYWFGEDSPKGHRHYFFFVKNAKNPDKVRGFYNEFLHPSLKEDRKTFELLASKMKVQPGANQLSGLGFSSTVSATTTFKVTNNTGVTKLFNVKF